MSAPYQAFRCADGYITIGGANDRLFRGSATCSAIRSGRDMPEFADNAQPRPQPRRARGADRGGHRTSSRARTGWRCSTRNDIPCGPINDYAQVFADPQVLAREMVVDIDHPTLGRIKALGSPIKMSATPPDVRRRAPLLGEHTDAVLGELGMRASEIAALRANGVVG